MTMLMTGCEDNFQPEMLLPEEEHYSGEKVLLAAGTTEASITTRADGKTYYMPADHRFVCKMYFKTNESGADYDTIRAHTAWLKVDNGGAGNSLYWKKDYPLKAQKEDPYHNDEYAPTFYWQNRKEHAFLAWTDLNHAKSVTGNDINFEENALTTYEYHTGLKEWQWVEKTFTVHNLVTPFTTLGNLRNAAMNASTSSLQSISTDEEQTKQKSFAASLGELPRREKWYSYFPSGRKELICAIDRPNGYTQENSYESIDDKHRKSKWYKMTVFDLSKKVEYTGEVTNTRVYDNGTYVMDRDGVRIAYYDKDVQKYYVCDADGFVTGPEQYVFCYQVYETKENKEIIDEYPAMAFNISRANGMNSMIDQPDILQALTIDKKPTSAVMEQNRVNLYFKHQFAQVQVNLKNSVDNSVAIEANQIEKVELLGVSKTGYMFCDMKRDGTMNVPSGFATSTFKEVVASEFTDEQLEDNPFGTSFVMFDRTLSEDDKNVSKIVKSYECITFGRLQAIRITWKETATEGGVEHVSTYRVPEKNDQNQALRLLEQGKKYIWNMELRRGTLAVVRTEIIPWEENQEEYSTDGFIVPTTSSSN